MIEIPALVPELDVDNLEMSLVTYREVFGFELLAERSEEFFAYLSIGEAHLMLQQATSPGRRFRTAPLEKPYGRGVNLQIRIEDVDTLYSRVAATTLNIVLPMEEKWYRQGSIERGNRQFVVSDHDGYLLRFFSDVGQRKITF